MVHCEPFHFFQIWSPSNYAPLLRNAVHNRLPSCSLTFSPRFLHTPLHSRSILHCKLTLKLSRNCSGWCSCWLGPWIRVQPHKNALLHLDLLRNDVGARLLYAHSDSLFLSGLEVDHLPHIPSPSLLVLAMLLV